MHLNDLAHCIDNYGPYNWIAPQQIEGLNQSEISKANRDKWFRKNSSVSEDPETKDEIVVDYLCYCLQERESIIEKGAAPPKSLDISAPDYVDASIFLICNLGSSYAGTHLSGWRNIITPDSASKCCYQLQQKFSVTDSYIKDILRDFILSVFNYDPLWGGNHTCGLTNQNKAFLDSLIKNGYVTINNQDARFFSDGTKRF